MHSNNERVTRGIWFVGEGPKKANAILAREAEFESTKRA